MAKRDTIANAITALDEERAKFDRRQDLQRAVYAALVGRGLEGLPVPTLSNEDARFFGTAGAWLSWRGRYAYGDDTRPTGGDILKGLEAAGFVPLAITLCKWDDWRATPEPGAQEQIPDEKGRYTLTDSWPLLPLWLTPAGLHNDTEAHAYYQCEGRIYRVTVEGPSGARVHARRKETQGDWYFESGSARVDYPQAWHAIGDGERIGGIAAQTRGYVDTPQGISGAIYFEPYGEQVPHAMTPAQLWAWLQANQGSLS